MDWEEWNREGRKPIQGCSFKKVAGCRWGSGLPKPHWSGTECASELSTKDGERWVFIKWFLKLQYFGHFMRRVDSDAGRDWGKEKGTTEDEMAGWHHWLDGCESGWTPGVGDGQGGLACCDSWGRKQSDTTEQMNWTELMATHCLVSALMCVLVTQSRLSFWDPWFVACQAPLAMEFSRQEYWSGLPLPSPTHTVYLHHFHSLYQMPIITFLCVLLLISLFKMPPTCSAEMLSGVHQVQEGCDVPYGENTCFR